MAYPEETYGLRYTSAMIHLSYFLHLNFFVASCLRRSRLPSQQWGLPMKFAESAWPSAALYPGCPCFNVRSPLILPYVQ